MLLIKFNKKDYKKTYKKEFFINTDYIRKMIIYSCASSKSTLFGFDR